MTHDERIEAIARAMRAADVEPRKFDAHWNVRHFDEQHEEAKQWWYRMATAALAAAGVGELEEEVTRLRDAIAHAIIMLQTGMPEYDAHDVLDVLREVMGK